MRAFTTCNGCGGYLKYLGPTRYNTHADCEDPYQPQIDLTSRFLAAAQAGDDASADRLSTLMDEPLRAVPRLWEAVQVYLSWGWPVFPLRPGTKVPLTKHGYLDATVDPDVAATWWQRVPSANIGLPTGGRFDVYDLDFRVPGTWERWVTLKQTEGALPPVHGMVCTASAGLHLYVHATGAGNAAGTAPGVDYRGIGGYVVAPPSRRADGRDWEWTARPSPFIKAGAAEWEPGDPR